MFFISFLRSDRSTPEARRHPDWDATVSDMTGSETITKQHATAEATRKTIDRVQQTYTLERRLFI